MAAANRRADWAREKLQELHLPDSVAGIVWDYLRYSEILAEVLDNGFGITMDTIGKKAYYINITPQPEDYMDDSDLDPEPNPHFEISISILQPEPHYGRVTLSTHCYHANSVWRWLQGEDLANANILSNYESKAVQELCLSAPPLDGPVSVLLRRLRHSLLARK